MSNDDQPKRQPKISQTILIKEFELKNENDFYYIAELKCWTVFNGKRWELDAYSLLYEKLFDTLKETYPLGSSNDELLIKRSINILKEVKKYRRPASMFDAYPELINCQNGVYNLNTDEFIEHSNNSTREFYITKIMNVNYNKGALCPKFTQFIKDIFIDYTTVDDVIAYMQKSLGYMISGYITNQSFYFFHGIGANGKTTLVEAIKNVVGNYSIVFSKNLLTDRKATISGSIYKELKGCRIINVNEFLSTDIINENTLKQLSGNDTLRVEIDNNMVIEDKLPCKFIGITNNLPSAKDAGHALFRRLQLIVFNRIFTAKDINLNLIMELKEESDGILNWLIEGYKEYKKDVILQMPTELQKEASLIRTELSNIKQYGFASEIVVIDPNLLITVSGYIDYMVNICQEGKLNYKLSKDEIAPNRIGQFLKQLSPKIYHHNNVKIYLGVGLQNSYTRTVTCHEAPIFFSVGDVTINTRCCSHIDTFIYYFEEYLKKEDCKNELINKDWLDALVKYRKSLIARGDYKPIELYP